MIGFVTTPQIAAAVQAGIESAQTSRDLPVYWTLVGTPILSGPHAGKSFILFDEQVMTTVLHQGTTPMDFPETEQLLAVLGGLEARIDLDPADITATMEPQTPES